MLKRWLFFLSYIIFFTAVPVLIYYFWPAKNSELENLTSTMTAVDPGDSAMIGEPVIDSANPYAIIDKQWRDSVNKADSIRMVESGVVFGNMQGEITETNKAVEKIFRITNFIKALRICFVASLLFAFGLSIYKLQWPGKKLGGLIAGISVFNFLYLPAAMIFISVQLPLFVIYAIYFIAGYSLGIPGVLMSLVVLLIYISTIILVIIGVRKGRKIIYPSDENV
jgi:hypothetical protein